MDFFGYFEIFVVGNRWVQTGNFYRVLQTSATRDMQSARLDKLILTTDMAKMNCRDRSVRVLRIARDERRSMQSALKIIEDGLLLAGDEVVSTA